MQRDALFARKLAPALHLDADQIGHHRIAVARRAAKRPAGYRPDMVLELAEEAGVDGPMAGILHPGRALVAQQTRGPAPALKHLHAQDADMADRFGDFACDAPRLERAIGVD